MNEMDPHPNLRLILVCVECGVTGLGDMRGWRAYRSDDLEDEEDQPNVLFYCPVCAQQEFGGR